MLSAYYSRRYLDMLFLHRTVWRKYSLCINQSMDLSVWANTQPKVKVKIVWFSFRSDFSMNHTRRSVWCDVFFACFFNLWMSDNNKKTETGFSFFVRLARKMMRLFKLIHFILCSFHKGFLTKGLKIQFSLSHVHKLFSINFISMALVTCPATFFFTLLLPRTPFYNALRPQSTKKNYICRNRPISDLR